MAEYEVTAHLEGETDIDIDFSSYTYKEIIALLWKIIRGQTITFEEQYVMLEGETYVEIEKADYY